MSAGGCGAFLLELSFPFVRLGPQWWFNFMALSPVEGVWDPWHIFHPSPGFSGIFRDSSSYSSSSSNCSDFFWFLLISSDFFWLLLTSFSSLLQRSLIGVPTDSLWHFSIGNFVCFVIGILGVILTGSISSFLFPSDCGIEFLICRGDPDYLFVVLTIPDWWCWFLTFAVSPGSLKRRWGWRRRRSGILAGFFCVCDYWNCCQIIFVSCYCNGIF